MKAILLALALLFGGAGGALTPADAAETVARPSVWRMGSQRDVPPFPRSERAQSVWASGACWSECGAYCAWGQSGCLERDAQGQCLKLTDKCDRYCQRECRTSGGPWLPIEFPWE